MSKYEDAIRLKTELAHHDQLTREIIARMEWNLPKRKLADGSDLDHGRKDIAIFNQILAAVNKLIPKIIDLVTEEQQKEIRIATEEAWGEMSELFKDFTLDLRTEVDELKAKLDHKAIPGEMP